MPDYRKKLIEVALPLEAINKEAAREKSIRHGHPSTLHLWWARRPLAACRAVLFASLVDDPSSHPEQFPTEEAQDKERQRLFRIIEELVKWENTNNEMVLDAARKEILRSTNGHPPPVLDPFCGGGSIPLEAQRLGLEAHGSDLNPVAVLITKALIEIPPKFAGRPPVNPEARKKLDHSKTWRGAQGLAEDVRYYGQWMRDTAEKRIGHLYPKLKLPKDQGAGEATVIAWLWARTVKCPNPACGFQTPLLSSFVLSSKEGNEAYLVPSLSKKKLTFSVSSAPSAKHGEPRRGLKRGMSGIFECVLCGNVTTRDYVSDQGKAGQLGVVQTAVVVEGPNGRLYLPSDFSPMPDSIPTSNVSDLTQEFSANPRDVWCRNFGLNTPADLFTPRQLVALTSFGNLLGEVQGRVLSDALKADMAGELSLNEGGTGAAAYADAVITYLAMAVDKGANLWSSLCSWMSDRGAMRETFARQAIPMVWDFAEANPFSDSGGNVSMFVQRVADAIATVPAGPRGHARQLDATAAINGVGQPLISTDPPYYGNIGYADLSDFFYVWLRRSVGRLYPDLFSTLLTPKMQELVATAYRFGGDSRKAEKFFEQGLGEAFARMRATQDSAYPLTVFYAFKQAESNGGEDQDELGTPTSTGWETMLEGLLKAGFTIDGTWPMRTESTGRSVARGTNALASSVVLACRPRSLDTPLATRREFIAALKNELPSALRKLQQGNIAPVDLAQAAIGPGMSVFSRYSKVVEADGSPMTVRTALALINQTLDEVLAEQEGEFDADTRWAVAWFEQYGFSDGPYGVAETLSRAKNTSVDGMKEAAILTSKAGKVRLLGRKDLAEDWDPASDRRITIWEVAHYLIRLLEEEGESAASLLLRQVGALGETARDLAYRLYGICERKKWAQEALPYNSLVVAWPEIVRLSRSAPREAQTALGL